MSPPWSSRARPSLRLDSQGSTSCGPGSPISRSSLPCPRGETPAIVVTHPDVLDQTTFAAISWTFAYLQALGVLSGAVIVGGFLLFVTTRASGACSRIRPFATDGLRRFTHLLSLGIELGAMIAPGALLGGALGWTAVELAEPHLDPLPLLSPPPLLEVPYVTIAGALGQHCSSGQRCPPGLNTLRTAAAHRSCYVQTTEAVRDPPCRHGVAT